jgi:lysophospholipid acyltransferase (LPLAT)-like uncharacterized protein
MKQHTEPRYHVNLPVRAEWNEKKTGKHVVTEGITEIVGPAEALVHLQQLPAVGTRITISIEGAKGAHVTANAEVLRLVRDIQQPLASLSVVNSKKQWRNMVWEPAARRVLQDAEGLSKAA